MPRRIASILITLILIAAPLCVAEGGTEVPTASAAAATASPTDGAELAESAEPTESAEPAAPGEVSVLPTPNPDDEAWTTPDGLALVSGLFKDVLDQCAPGAIVYIQSDEPVMAMDYTTELVKDFQFLPDPVKYEEDEFIVVLSDTAPEGVTQPDDGHGYLFAWVEEVPDPVPTEAPTKEPEEMEIHVDAEGYNPGAWSNVVPAFTLSGIPAGDERYVYAVIAYDERFIILSGDTFTATDEGAYVLRFVILDGIGDVVAKSAKYELMLDFTPPAYVSASMVGNSYQKYELYAEDARSGIVGYSNDGGATWVAPDESGAARFTGVSGDVIPAGMLLAMDGAGNVAAYMDDFYLPVKGSGGGGGGGGGGSGDGSGYSHSPSGEAVDLNPYNALELTLPEEPMAALTVGETLLPLALQLKDADGFDIPTDYEATFTAALAVWGGAEDPDGAADADGAAEAEPDTLVLTVTDDPAIEGSYAYAFFFNGIVYRMLQNSGIDYLVFRVGDDVTAFSTAGFTAGTEYTRLKAGGVSTKAFNYEAVLEGDKAAPDQFQMLLSLTVDDEGEEKNYDVTGEETGEMYYYDVQIGPAQMMDVPFGAWDLAADAQ